MHILAHLNSSSLGFRRSKLPAFSLLLKSGPGTILGLLLHVEPDQPEVAGLKILFIYKALELRDWEPEGARGNSRSYRTRKPKR